MANALYDNMKNLMLGGGTHTFVDLNADTIKVFLHDNADDTIVLATDQDLADVVAGAIVATATLGSLTVGTVAAGVFDAADTTFTAVTGDQAEQLVLYKDSGVGSTSPLIGRFDTFGAGMPVTPNGGDIVVAWNASGIITL